MQVNTIDAAILRSMMAKKGAAAYSPGHFQEFGNAAAVRQALSRLAKAGKIRRIRHGLYDLPREHPVIGKTAPDPMAAVRALMEGSSAQWQVSGAYAANLLGAGRPAGSVIQAIRHLRERGLEAAHVERLRKRLDADTKSELTALTPKLPAWMRSIVQHLTAKAKP